MHPYIEQQRQGDQPWRFEDALKQLGEIFPLLYELEHTEQDPIWHAEGNVAIHTAMVMEHVQALIKEDDLGLSQDEQLMVILGALLHDIAKPLTTIKQERDGIIRTLAPRHAQRGADWLAWRVMELGLPHHIALQLIELVRYHHEPKFLVIKDAPAPKFLSLMRKAPMRALYLLERADMLGRECEDQQEQLNIIEMFRLLAQEDDAFDQPHALSSFITPIAHALSEQEQHDDYIERALMEGLWDFEQGQIYTPQEALARSYKSQERFLRVTLTCGPSASGKSTWIAQHHSNTRVISMDELRHTLTKDPADQSKNAQVFALAREQFKDALRAQQDVVWDATSLRFDQREAVLQTARQYGAHTTLAVFHAPPSLSFARNKARARQVPVAVMQRQLESAQWPQLDEAHRTLYINQHGQTAWDSRDQWLPFSPR